MSIKDLVHSKAKAATKSRNTTGQLSLAFLSACETAMGGLNNHNESLHLVSAMHFAGFQSVVGTMWYVLPSSLYLCKWNRTDRTLGRAIRDDDAPVVTDAFYKHLFRNSDTSLPDIRDSAHALHLATEKLRKEGKSFRRWVPFVHFGV